MEVSHKLLIKNNVHNPVHSKNV